MKITDVRIFPYSGKKKTSLVAFANVTFDKAFVVRGFRIFEGKKGAFASCPSELVGDEYKDTAFPITADFREKLMDAIVEAWEDFDPDEEDEQPKKKTKKRQRDVDEDELPD